MKDFSLRDSNIELLRLILMVFAIIHHSVGTLYAGSVTPLITSIDTISHAALACFILISGFNGIRFSVSKLLYLLLYIVFYSLVFCVFSKLFLNVNISTKEYIKCFLPITNGYYWVVAVYLQLFLLAPFLNILFSNLDNRKFSMLLVVLAFIVLYIGLFRSGNTSFDGKHLINFIFVYSLGHAIKRLFPFVVRYKFKIRWRSVMALFIIGILVCVATSMFGMGNQFVNTLFYHYHSLGLLITSIILFSLFLTFKLKSRIINYLGLSSFAIYLFHEHPYMKNIVYVDFFSNLQVGQFHTIIYIMGGSLLIACMAVVVDQPRIWLFRIFEPVLKIVIRGLNPFAK